MKLFEVAEHSTAKQVYKVLLKWHERNTPAIGKLNISPNWRRCFESELYRGVEISREERAALDRGDSIELPTKGFSSWTADPKVAKQFATGAGVDGIVIRRKKAQLSIWLNVDDFLSRNKLPELERGEEQEYIVKDKGPLVVTNDDLLD